jgi:hypothetical protein
MSSGSFSKLLAPVVASAWLAILPVAGCRTGAPLLGPDLDGARGTLAGRVEGPEGIAPAEGRLVEAIEVGSGRKFAARTNNTGGYTLLVPAGQYRLEVELREGETIHRQPDPIEIEAGEVVSDAVVILAGGGVANPTARSPQR